MRASLKMGIVTGLAAIFVSQVALADDCARPVQSTTATIVAADTMDLQALTASTKGSPVAGPVGNEATPDTVTGCARSGGMMPAAVGGLLGLVGIARRRRN